MHYTIECELGHGGMGCVYKARDAAGRPVALKMISPAAACHPEFRELFYSEVETLRMMNHPSVVHIVGNPYQDKDGALYLPMEYVEGETIEQAVARMGGPFGEQTAVRLMSDILDAISYVHSQKRIHRDIKPSNIILRPGGGVCVIDFGIAKDAHMGTDHTVGRIIGTDGYMSPEQADGLNIDTRTDIYSLGCLLFFMLTGRHAVSKGANDYETVRNIFKSVIPPPSTYVPGLSPHLDDVVMKAVDKNMLHRYQTANDFKEALGGEITGNVPAGQAFTVTVGTAPDNDIQFRNEYVSRHHLNVTANNGSRLLTITDTSTNGTGVNGVLLRGAVTTLMYNGNARRLPVTLLAGRGENRLDWNQVIARLQANGWQPPTDSTLKTVLLIVAIALASMLTILGILLLMK